MRSITIAAVLVLCFVAFTVVAAGGPRSRGREDAGTAPERCASPSSADAGLDCEAAFADPAAGVEVYLYRRRAEDGGVEQAVGVGIRNTNGWVVLPMLLPMVGGPRSPAG